MMLAEFYTMSDKVCTYVLMFVNTLY